MHSFYKWQVATLSPFPFSAMSEEQVDRHVTTIEWETETEKVKVTIRVERFPKEPVD
jgi:hypothetical protein